MEVCIYQPAKNAMQSGKNLNEWIVQFLKNETQKTSQLMGWIGHGDTHQQLDLRFPSKQSAIDFATDNELTYYILSPKERIVKPKSYASNFAYERKQAWTH